MAARQPSQRRARTKQTSPRNPSSFRPPSQDFDSLHFPNGHYAQRFHNNFMGKTVIPSFYIKIDEFSDITICGSTIAQLLRQWDMALGIKERVYENLVRVFFYNMDLSATW